MKLSVDEIRQRFDAQVERFSNLETGQTATVDAPLAMALVAEAAAGTTPHARTLVDIGCGAGNYSLKLLERLPNLEDTPRSLMFQLDLLRAVGFAQVEVLHKNSCFAAFGAIKGNHEKRE